MAHENALLVEVMDEIESLHRHFVEWFTGEVPKVDAIFNDTIGNRFAKDIELIPPAGVTLSYSDLISGLYSFHDGNPGFRIAIRNVRIREVSGDLIVAAYEEWQRHALNSTPPDNGRAATVVFRRTESGPRALEWIQVHETWLPEDVMRAGPYDF